MKTRQGWPCRSKIREHWEPGILYHALQLKSPWDVLDPSAVRQEESGQFLLDRWAPGWGFCIGWY